MAKLTLPAGEVSVYDFEIHLDGFEKSVFVNVKSAVAGNSTSKDDISKGKGLLKFMKPHRIMNSLLRLCTSASMTI